MGNKLQKSNQDVILSGVCAGVAEFFGLRASDVRLIWVLFTVFSGGGLLVLYIALVIILKPADF